MIFQNKILKTISIESESCCSSIQEILNNSDLSNSEKIAQLNSETLGCVDEEKPLQSVCLEQIAKAYLLLGQEKKFLQLVKGQVQQAKKQSADKALAKGYVILGNYYKEQSKKDSAYYYYFRGFKEVKALKSKTEPTQLGWLLYHMATIQESTKDYIGAEKNTVEALRLFSIENKPKSIFKAYNLLAITQNGLKKFDEALEYHLKAKEVIPEIEDESDRSIFALINANNIASIYLRARQNEQAVQYYDDFLANENELRFLLPSTLSKALASRAEAKLQLMHYSEEEIIMDLDKAYDLAHNLNSKSILAMVNHNYAKTYLAFDKKEIALKKAIIAKELAEESESNDRLLEILKFLAENEFEGSSKYAKAYFALNDRLTSEERSIQEKFARIQFETDEKEELNAKLAKQKELLAGIAIGLLLLGVGALIIITQRVSNQKLRFEKTQQDSNQEIFNLMLAQKGKLEEGKKSEQLRISEELHDGILGQMLGIRLILSGLNERDDEEAILQRAELIDKLQELEEEIRVISHELNEESFKKVDNFILSLYDLFQTVEKTGKVNIQPNFDPSINWNEFNGNSKINIYRIVQEAVQNSIKHAECKNVFVVFETSKKFLNLSIQDDGKGFRTSRTKRGIGLKNIISRTKKLKGEFNFTSTLGQGTKVQISIPLDEIKTYKKKPSTKALSNNPNYQRDENTTYLSN